MIGRMGSLNVDGLRAFMGDAAADMTDDDIRVALVRLGREHWPDASDAEVETRIRAFVGALDRTEIVGQDGGLPYWYEEWWGEVSGGAPTTD